MDRRQFLSLAGAGAAASALRPAGAAARRPNIILIMADDMGFSDIGCYGSRDRARPTSTAWRAGGVRFTQFYNTARCCPTRASLLTGLYPHQAGVGHMVDRTAARPATRATSTTAASPSPRRSRPAGYRTLMSGKWHVGEERPHWPVDRGFEHYFGLISGASELLAARPGPPDGARQRALHARSGRSFYMTDAFTDNAVKFIGEYGRKPDPFFLYLAFTSPHWPLHAWPEDIAKYRGKYMQGLGRAARASATSA